MARGSVSSFQDYKLKFMHKYIGKPVADNINTKHKNMYSKPTLKHSKVAQIFEF